MTMIRKARIALSESETRRPDATALLEAEAFGDLTGEFPTLEFSVVAGPSRAGARDSAVIEASQWQALGANLYTFDHIVDTAIAGGLDVVEVRAHAHVAASIGFEVLTRYQRFVFRRNRFSSGPAFQRLLDTHQSLHDRDKPLVFADYEHALDVWQWVLRLEPHASLALQAAALFHDVERLVSESEARIEQYAVDHDAFHNEHARRGAALTRRVLTEAGIDDETSSWVADRVDVHERPMLVPKDHATRVLVDADALSFFSLNSPRFLDYYGTGPTIKRMRHTVGRMSAGARARLDRVRLRADVAQLLAESVRPEEVSSVEAVAT